MARVYAHPLCLLMAYEFVLSFPPSGYWFPILRVPSAYEAVTHLVSSPPDAILHDRLVNSHSTTRAPSNADLSPIESDDEADATAIVRARSVSCVVSGSS